VDVVLIAVVVALVVIGVPILAVRIRGIRLRIEALEAAVTRMQGRLDGLSGVGVTPSRSATGEPIDIEPFVD